MIQNVSDPIQFIFSGLIMGSSCYYVWSKFLNIKYDILSFKFICSFLIFCIALFLNYYFVDSYYKVIIAICLSILILRIFYTNDLRKAIVTSIVLEVLLFIAELFFSIIMLILLRNNVESAMQNYFGSTLTNFIICSITIVLSNFKIFKRFYLKLLNITNKLKLSSILIAFAILIISFNLFLALPYYTIDTVKIVLVNSLMIIIYSIIVFQFIQAKNRYIEINDKYSLTETSLKELQSNINRLMTVNHEHKNQLLTIRTMVANKDKDVLKNIDTIIDRKIKDDKELKVRTSIISNTMLGALVYSKLLTMKENNINYNIHIDKALSKSNFIKLDDKTNVDICKVVGVYLDNAIEAVNGIDVKEINIDLFLEDNYLYITIANTFDGNVDVNMLHDYGYTTKSEGHGYGLALVKEVIKENNNLDSETEIIDKVFIQKLKIKM